MVSSDKFLKTIANKPFDDEIDPLGGIRYVSGPCGSEKTTGVAHYISENIQTSPQNFMYVAQSVRLSDEFEATLTRLGVTNIIKIHNESTSNVVLQVMNVLKNPPEMTVVLITHSAFLRLPYFADKSGWQIFIDEAPDIDRALWAVKTVPLSADTKARSDLALAVARNPEPQSSRSNGEGR